MPENNTQFRKPRRETSPAKFAQEVGRTTGAIYKAIEEGRLGTAVRKVGKRWYIDVDLAKQNYLGHHPSDEPEPPREPKELGEVYEGQDLEDSQAVERFWKAKAAELAFKQKSGELVEASIIEAKYADEVTACRTKLLAVVSRIRQRVSLNEEGFQLIEELIREALEELGNSKKEVM